MDSVAPDVTADMCIYNCFPFVNNQAGKSRLGIFITDLFDKQDYSEYDNEHIR
jgi:hypothetical protein